MILNKFNIRVYGVVLKDEKLLLVKENFKGFEFTKFPGGGVELGEGLLDALHREIMEELDSHVTTYKHFYTTEFCQQSAFRENEQIVSVYYLVELDHYPNDGLLKTEEELIMLFNWMPLSELSTDHVTFPIDKHVLGMLLNGSQSKP